MSQIDLFAKILHCFQLLSSFEKIDRVLNTPLEYTHIVHARLSLWQWYSLMAFNEDEWMNEWIPEFGKVDLLSNYVLSMLNYNFQCHGTKLLKSFILYQQNFHIRVNVQICYSKHFRTKTDKTELYNYIACSIFDLKS